MTSDDGATTSEEAKTDQLPPPSTKTTTHPKPRISWCDSYSKIQVAVESLSTFLPSVPAAVTSDERPATILLRDPEISNQFNHILRQPDAGAGENNLCRWLYDTFQSNVPDLQLVVLRFLPVLAGVYLSRASLHKPLAGFEAVLLALYGHETAARDGNAVTVTIPDLSNSSIYHESTQPVKNDATELNMAVISPSLDPQGRVKYTRRARIVGVALELYYSKVFEMPVESKLEFCEFCKIWAGEFGPGPEVSEDADQGLSPKSGRIDLPWEILQPAFRILGHCLMWREGNKHEEVYEAACGACKALHARAQHDINPRAVLASSSLLKLVKMDEEAAADDNKVDYTEIPLADNVVNV